VKFCAVQAPERLAPDRVIVAPGSRAPDQAGVPPGAVRRLGARIAVFVLCLGHH
jgi:anthranilate/para-aminobenzoate synthase component II